MEKPARSKGNKIFSFLPKTATVSFQNPPYSPGREKRVSENLAHKFRANGGKSFSGPIISIIPVEARRKSKNGSFDDQEPTSPKVSCIGQIKHKNKICKAKRSVVRSQSPSSPPPKLDRKKKQQKKQSSSSSTDVKTQQQPKRSASSIRNLFRSGMLSGSKKKTSSCLDQNKPTPLVLQERAPSLNQMRRFASGRSGALAGFDWRDFAAEDRKCYSDDEKEGSDGENYERDEVIIPHSAPLMVGGNGRVALEPRKEINLWKRRTVAPIRPLELNN